MGGAPQVHPLGATFYSQTPFRCGEYVAKWSLRPISKGLTDLADAVIDVRDRPDAIREDVNRDLIETGGTWELQVQLCTDVDRMPIKDATVRWNEDESPFRTVVMLEMPPQQAWQRGVTDRVDDALSFNMWHALAFQPLGGINRARDDTYRKSHEFRARFNRCPMHEPAALADLPLDQTIA